MGSSNWKNVLKQIEHKPAKKARFLKHNVPKKRTTGITKNRCERTDQFGAHIKSYGINLRRQSFREIAEEIGFKKYS